MSTQPESDGEGLPPQTFLAFDKKLDFCLWVLEKDGLAVPPFTRHPDGDGALRTAGLASSDWWAWTKAVAELSSALEVKARNSAVFDEETHKSGERVSRVIEEATHMGRVRGFLTRGRGISLELAGLFRFARSLPRIPDPPEVWPGSEIIRELLNERWQQYKEIAKQRRRGYGYKQESVRAFVQSDDFPCLQARLPEVLSAQQVFVHIVRYPGPTVCMLRPNSFMIGLLGWPASPPKMHQTLVDEMARLVKEAV